MATQTRVYTSTGNVLMPGGTESISAPVVSKFPLHTSEGIAIRNIEISEAFKVWMTVLKIHLPCTGYYIWFASPKRIKMSVKWQNSFEYYYPKMDWAADEWSHVTFTWAPGQRIRAYLNGCDMDADDSKQYASKERAGDFLRWYAFLLDGPAGTSVDELYIWHVELNSHQIWQFYTQGATVWLRPFSAHRCVPFCFDLDQSKPKCSKWPHFDCTESLWKPLPQRQCGSPRAFG